MLQDAKWKLKIVRVLKITSVFYTRIIIISITKYKIKRNQLKNTINSWKNVIEELNDLCLSERQESEHLRRPAGWCQSVI